MSGNSKKLIAFNYFGSKFTWLEWLYTYFPLHTHFVDVFGGSFVVTLNKPLSKIDTANDINSDVVNFFKVLRDHPDQLMALLELTPVAREEFNNCWESEHVTDPIEKARRFFVRVRQSILSLGTQHKNKGWHLSKTSSRCNVSETVSKWHNGISRLLPVVDKLRYIQIENDDFRSLIKKLDYEEAFFYCDPPYPPESRNSKNDYKFDFTDKDHEELSEILNSIKGKAMISSYDCKLMRRLYTNWNMVTFPPKNNNFRGGRVQECIWINYDIPGNFQTKIFEAENLI